MPPVKPKEEEKSEHTPRIFVDNDALAFFNVYVKGKEVLDLSKLLGEEKEKYGEYYNFMVEKNSACYFNTTNHNGNIRTVSVATSCIVFGAYTINKKGEIQHSGVYHALSIPHEERFKHKLYQLIDAIRQDKYTSVRIKAAGSDKEGIDIKEIIDELNRLMKDKNLELDIDNSVLGGGYHRVIEFDPLSGQLTIPNEGTLPLEFQLARRIGSKKGYWDNKKSCYLIID